MVLQPKKSEIILKLYARLKQSPCTINLLEDWKRKNGYTFSNRSLYRYLDELSQGLSIKGENIEVTQGEYNKKTWKLVYNNSQKDLSLADINSFYLSKIFLPSSIIKLRQSSFSKIESLIYEQASKGKFEFAADALGLSLNNSSFYEFRFSKEQQETIDQLIWAIQNHRKIMIEAFSPHVDIDYNNIKPGHTVLPLTLHYHRGSLHLFAYNEDVQAISIISFDMLASFIATNDIFNPKKYIRRLIGFFNAHFGISPNINDKIYSIELEFAGGTGAFIKNFFWHNTQKTKLLKNGNTLLSLQCGINRELVGWIFQWMNNVQVKKPLLLKNRVAELHQECANIHTSTAAIKYKNTFL
ncbi:MAG: WYL domain-containing protein [Niabella sp.]